MESILISGQNSGAENASSAIAELKKLIAAKKNAECLIAEMKDGIASAKKSLDSLITEPTTPENKEYLSAGKKAWRLSIKAYKLSILAFQDDITAYEEGIAAIQRSTPEARLDH